MPQEDLDICMVLDRSGFGQGALYILLDFCELDKSAAVENSILKAQTEQSIFEGLYSYSPKGVTVGLNRVGL